MEMLRENKKEIVNEIKKPVEAIQCTNHFSLLQRKIYNVLLANAAGNLRPDVTHRISIGILCKLMGYRSNDYQMIKNKFRELMDIKIEWDIVNENGNKVWAITTPLSFAKIIDGEGTCEYEFAKSLLPYLDRPAQYAKFSLAVQAKFKSSYGLALYENCERYRNIGQTRAFDISTFRKLMGLKDGEYPEFFAMKRRVIDQAIKEVNKNADFDIRPEYEKIGKQTVKIKFFIALKKPLIEIEQKSEKGIGINSELVIILDQIFGLSKVDIEELLKDYDEVYIKEKTDYILNSQSFKKGIIDSMGGYLKVALNRDYKSQKSSKEILKVTKDKEVEKQENLKKLEKDLWNAENSYKEYCIEKLWENIEKLQEIEKQLLLTNFEGYINKKNALFISTYKKNGHKCKRLLPILKMFLEENYPDITKELYSQDYYIKNFHNHIYDHYKEVNESI